MRRIFSIAIILFVGFWVIYGLFPPAKATIDNIAINTLGPVAFNGIVGVYDGVLASVGMGGFAAIVLGGGAVIGFVAHFLWVKTDWKIRRWGRERTAKDMGYDSRIPAGSTTPAGATTRPVTEEKSELAPTPEPVPEEKKEAAT